jgi:hypothetical protein
MHSDPRNKALCGEIKVVMSQSHSFVAAQFIDAAVDAPLTAFARRSMEKAHPATF